METDSGTAPLLSVIVLSYDRPALLERALQSLIAQTYSNLQLILVDNRSPHSDDVADLATRFDRVQLVACSENLGFTGGMNRGLQEAAGEYVYFTEDDLELESTCLARLVRYLEDHEEAGLVGPVMFNLAAGTVRCAGGHVELGTIYRMTVRGTEPGEPAPSEPFHTGYLPGASIAARRSLLRELAGFRDDFFMYSEDVDLCARVLERGLSIDVVPEARVWHHEPTHTGVSETVAFHKAKNFLALYLLHARWPVIPGFVLRYGVLALIRTLATKRSDLPTFGRAWWWAMANGPRLLDERRNRIRALKHNPAAPATVRARQAHSA